MWWFPMSFTLRFWVCSSFHAQNETGEVKNQNLCHGTEQNVPTDFMWKKPQSNLQALERRDHATGFPLLSQGSHAAPQPWKRPGPLNLRDPISPISSLCACH